MIIKIIEISDLRQMVEIEKENYRDPWDFKILYYEVVKNEKTRFYGAYIDNLLVGYLGFWQIFETADIINVAVSKKFQRQGIATALFKHLFKQAKVLSLKTITLEVNTKNMVATNLYYKLGFKIIRFIENYYDNDGDAYMMQKELV